MLQLTIHQRPDFFHSATVHAEIAVSDTRSRAEMDGLALLVEQELDVVDKTQQEAGAFDMEVGVVFLHQPRAWQSGDDSLERLFRLRAAFSIAERRNRVALVPAVVETQLGLSGQGDKLLFTEVLPFLGRNRHAQAH